MFRAMLCLLWAPIFLRAQEKSFPLEDVKISGSQVPAAVVLEIGGLKLGAAINTAGIEEACQKLGQSGIFEAVGYHYQSGPKHGYVVTLALADPRLPADELNKLMQNVVGNDGYTDRHFRMLVELNLRMAYEQHGMFKVQFPSIRAQEVNPAAVTVATILEGPQYKLANVEFSGENLPTDAMLAAAQFKKGEVANWTHIQQGIWRTELPLRRMGYTDAVSQSERVLVDANQTLVVKISFWKGPLYRFGQVTFVGLSPDLEAKARKVWKMESGDPYDLMYPNDFLRAFSKVADLRSFKLKAKAEPGPGDHVKNVTLVFESK